MNFQSESFADESIVDRLAMAAQRRDKGFELQQDVSNFWQHFDMAVEHAENTQSGTRRDLLMSFLKQHGDDLDMLDEYLISRGYEPDSNMVNKCMQLMEAWDEHVADVQDFYQSDNFLFGGKGREERQRRRLERKQKRVESRAARKKMRVDARTYRRQARQANKRAKTAMRAERRAMRQSGQEEIYDEPMQEEMMQDQPVYEGDSVYNEEETPEYTDMHPDADRELVDDVYESDDIPAEMDISPEQAEAEILGQQTEGESYDSADGSGSDKGKTWATLISAAVDLGRRTVADITAAKKAGKKLPVIKAIGRNLQPTAQRAMKEVEEQKKKEFVKTNWPVILLAGAALLGIGWYIAKPKTS